jgi:hypothetical protein
MSSTLYFNGKVLTLQEGNATASAMLVTGSRISAVGTLEEVSRQLPEEVQPVNLQGRCVMPGFNDAHVHVWKVGQLEAFIIDLRNIESIQALQQKVKQVADTLPPGRWVVGRGFNEQVLQEKRLPVKEDLDAISTTHPVYLIRTCAHIAVANTKALQLAQVTSATQAPAGGVMGKTKAGELTGVFYETALGLITDHIPTPTVQEYMEMIQLGADRLLRVGVTSATDPAVHPELLTAYRELATREELPMRINAMPILLPDGGHEPYPIPERVDGPWLNVNTVKFFSDGGLSGKTAALARPYRHTSDYGVLRLQTNTFLQLATAAQEKGFRVGTHAIGDQAIELVLGVYRKLHAHFGNTRNRIEHFGLPSNQHKAEAAALGLVAVPQPVFIHELGENFIQALDDEYLTQCYPVRSLLQVGCAVAFSTDAPVVKDINPFTGIAAAVTRKTSQGNTIAIAERITVAEALRLYTQGGAYAEGKEMEKGILAPGYLADFIVLDKNPMEVSVDQLQYIQVRETYVNGQRVFSTDHNPHT